jgi:hypothetical protein
MANQNELPLLKSARREAVVATCIWFIATVYSVGVCYLYGYGRSPETLTFVLGFPDWVFWGLVVPWLTFTVIASIFAMCFMSDEDLDGDGLAVQTQKSE